jgi:hypothetical protein
MWKIRWAANNASKWQIGYNSAFKWLIERDGKCKMQVGISQSIQRLECDLDVRANVVLFPAQALTLSLLPNIQTGSKTHTVFYSIDTGRCLARGTEARAHSSPFTLPSFQIRKQHIYVSPLSHMSSWFAKCQLYLYLDVTSDVEV